MKSSRRPTPAQMLALELLNAGAVIETAPDAPHASHIRYDAPMPKVTLNALCAAGWIVRWRDGTHRISILGASTWRRENRDA